MGGVYGLDTKTVISMIDKGEKDTTISLSDMLNTSAKKELVTDIQNIYSKILDSEGANIRDPYNAYVQFYNKNKSMIGLSPQMSGQSHAFFTRPDLNLNNPINRKMIPFIDYMYETEIGKLVLDLLQYPGTPFYPQGTGPSATHRSKSNFDLLKSNLCVSVPAGKDYVMDKYDTDGDLVGNQLTYATGMNGIKSIGEISITYKDPLHSPIFLNEFMRMEYISAVCSGLIMPRYKYLKEKSIDYTNSLYVFRPSNYKNTIIRWGRFMGMFPISLTLSSIKHDPSVVEDSSDMYDLSVTYAYNRYLPMDVDSFVDFNKLSAETAFQSRVLGDESVKYILNERKVPERLLRQIDHNRSKEEAPSKVWAEYPFIIGNELKFL